MIDDVMTAAPCMKANRSVSTICCLILGLALSVASPAAAQNYKVEKASAPAPQELSAAVRDALVPDAIRVVGASGPLCEIWLRKAVPAKAAPTQELGISYGQLDEGTLVAAVRFDAETKDYRGQRVRAGVYTLRYALIPVDGNHQGVAPNRDFLLLSPAAADADPATISREALLALSRKAVGGGHPSPWSLPAADAPSSSAGPALPRLSHQDDGDLWILQFSVPVQAGSSPASTLGLSLVVVGRAPEA